MKVVVFGATGFSGKAVLQELISEQMEVTAFVRTKAALADDARQVTVVEGDVFDRRAVAGVLEGCDAVIQCLGVGGKGSGKRTTLVSDATRLIVDEMTQRKVRRLIAMSNVGAGNSASFLPWYFRKLILPYFMQWLQVIIDDKNRMEPIIMQSELDWTILRCPNIVDKAPKGTWHATLDGKDLTLSITRADLAKFMVQLLKNGDFIRQAPSISN